MSFKVQKSYLSWAPNISQELTGGDTGFDAGNSGTGDVFMEVGRFAGV